MEEIGKTRIEPFYIELSKVYKDYKEGIKSLGLKELSSEYAWGVKKDKVISLMEPLDRKIILDVGCGRGDIFIEFKISDKIMFGIGLDISGDQFPKDYPLNISFSKGDAKMLPFKDEYFDRVVLVEVIEHLYPNDARKMSKEIRRVLKNDGRFVITTPRSGGYWLLLVPIFAMIDFFYGLVNSKLKEIWTMRRESRKNLQEKYGVKEHTKVYTERELINILENSGFTVLESTGSTISPYLSPFTRANEFNQRFFKIWKWLNKILVNISEKFCGDIIVLCKKSCACAREN